MLERALSSRRGNFPSDGDDDDINGDESKTKKQQNFLFRIITNRWIRVGSGGHCILLPGIAIALLLMLAFSFLFTSRGFVCISSSSFHQPVSRAGFFGLDGLDSDFGALGVPWCRSKHGKTVEWTSKDLLKGLEEFVPIYETRPIKNNMYGMGFDHSFGLWFIARWLKPDLMIESGAFKGHSTWVLRQAMPDTRLRMFKESKDWDSRGTHWGDHPAIMAVGVVDGASEAIFHTLMTLDPSRSEWDFCIYRGNVVDHLDGHTELLISFTSSSTMIGYHGGGHSCFKDSDEARIRSRRKKFYEKAVDIEELCGPGEAWWGVRGYMRDNFNHSNKPISYAQHFQNSRYIESILDVYWELPPVAGPSLTHQTRYDPARAPSPIVEDGRYGLFQRLGLAKLDNSVFNGYTQMVYLQISEQ